MMKTTWNLAPALALLMIAATPAPMRAAGAPQVVEQTKEGISTAADKTKQGLSKSGEVIISDRAGRNRAARVASNTEGVHRVVNRLTIGPKRN